MAWANVNLRVDRYVLDYLPIWWYLNHQKFVSTWFTYLFDHMHEKICTIHTFKIPPHLVRLLGKIYALSIEVLVREEIRRPKFKYRHDLISCNSLTHYRCNGQFFPSASLSPGKNQAGPFLPRGRNWRVIFFPRRKNNQSVFSPPGQFFLHLKFFNISYI